MKVGLICPYNIARGGGVQECLLALRDELKQRGHIAKIITPLPRNHVPKTNPSIIFLGKGTDVKSPFHTTGQISVNVNTDNVKEVLSEHQFDILHFHEPWVPILSRQVLVRSRSVNIATFHAKLPETLMTKTIERVITPYTRSVLKYFSALTAVSPAAAEYVHNLTSQPIKIIPNGIDLNYYTPPLDAKTDSKRRVLFIGRLEKRKGLKYLLKAWRQLLTSNPGNIELIIAGDGPERKRLESFCKENNLSNVYFTGFVDTKMKLELLQTATVFCSPALYGESFGIVLLEAMACGLPIVAGRNPGYEAVLRDRGSLSLIEPSNVEEFSRRLDLFINDQAMRLLWRRWALNYVKQFNYPIIVDQYENLYNSIVKSTPN